MSAQNRDTRILGTALTEEQITEMELTVPEGVTAVWGADWEDKPVVRGVRGDTRVALIGAPGDGYWGSGPTMTMCPECGELFYAGNPGASSTDKQRHLSVAHSINAPMLP